MPSLISVPEESTLQLSADDVELLEEMQLQQEAVTDVEPTFVDDEEAEVVIPTSLAAEEKPALELEFLPPPDREQEREFYLREARALQSHQPERAGLMWYEAAKTSERAASDPNVVSSSLERSLKLAPNSPYLISLLRRMLLRIRRYDQVLELTDKLDQLGGDSAAHVGALVEAAALVDYHLGNRQGAIDLLRQALGHAPGHALSLVLIGSRQLELNQHDEAADSFEQLAEVLASPLDRANCLYAAGTIHEMHLGELEHAEQDYTRSIEFYPEHPPALMALCDLHQHLGRWPQLCRDLERLAAFEIDTPGKVSLLLRAGSLHLYRTGELETAARALATAAQLAPEDPAPLSRLAYVFEATGHQEELIATLRQLIPITLDAPGRAAMLTRIGWLLQNRSEQLEEAIASYREALVAYPGYIPALQALGTLYRQRGDFENLLQITIPDTEGTDTAERRAVRCLEIAGILSEHLEQPAEAISSYRRALELCPDLHLAFWRLGALLKQHQRYSDLAELLSDQAEITSDRLSRHHLLMELAYLQAHKLQRIEHAVETLKAARKLRQTRSPAMMLIDLYETCNRHADLADLLLAEAKETKDGAEATWRSIQAAMILEDPLGEHDRALAIYREVLEQDPQSPSALHASGRIYHRLGRWNELIDLHRHELNADPQRPDAASLWCRIGRIHEESLGQPNDAIDAYMEALNLDAGCTIALDALERLVRGEGRYPDLVQVLRRYAETRTDPHAAADALCRAAELADTQLDDLDEAVRLYDEALKRSKGFQVAINGLYDVLLRQQQFERAASTMQELIEGAGSMVERSHRQLRLARLREYRLGEAPDLELYEAAAAGSSHGACLILEQLRSQRVATEELEPDLLGELAEQIVDPALSSALFLECAQRHEIRGNHEGHLHAAEQAYSRCPEEPAVLWSLQRAVAGNGEWDRLAELLEEESRHVVDPLVRLQLLSDATSALLEAQRPKKAEALARQCLAIEPGHLPSLRLLTHLCDARRDWRELAIIQDQLASASEDRENRLHACLKAADLWSQRVGEAGRALASLKLILADDPSQPDAFVIAEQLLTSQGDFDQLSQLYVRRIKVCSDAGLKAELLRSHARLLRDHLGNMAHAIGELTLLITEYPDDLEARLELADLLVGERRWSDAAKILDEIIGHAEEPEQKKAARLRLAQIWLGQLQEPTRARSVLEQALEADPSDTDAKRLLVEVSLAEGRWEESQRLLDELTGHDQPEVQVWAMGQLADVARVGLRDEKLRHRYECEALVLAGAHPGVLDMVLKRYRQRGAQLRLVEIGNEVVQSTTHADVAARLRLVLASIMLEDLNQPERALENLRESLAVDAGDRTANLLFARALEKNGDMETAAVAYRKLLSIDMGCTDAYRGLSSLMTVLGKPAVAASAAAVLGLLGDPEFSRRSPDSGSAPKGQINPAEMPIDSDLRAIHHLLALALPHLGSIYPLQVAGTALKPSHPVSLAVYDLASSLCLSGIKTSIGGDQPVVSTVGDPVVLSIHSRLAAQHNSAHFRFWVGRALGAAITGATLLDRLSDRELDDLIGALATSRPIAPETQQLRKKIQRELPRKIRKQVEQLEPPATSAELWSRYRALMRQRADSLGLLLSGNTQVALSELARAENAREAPMESARLRKLVSFSISDEFSVLHDKLWSTSRTA